jgi:hypothetical protein
MHGGVRLGDEARSDSLVNRLGFSWTFLAFKYVQIKRIYIDLLRMSGCGLF